MRKINNKIILAGLGFALLNSGNKSREGSVEEFEVVKDGEEVVADVTGAVALDVIPDGAVTSVKLVTLPDAVTADAVTAAAVAVAGVTGVTAVAGVTGVTAVAGVTGVTAVADAELELDISEDLVQELTKKPNCGCNN